MIKVPKNKFQLSRRLLLGCFLVAASIGFFLWGDHIVASGMTNQKWPAAVAYFAVSGVFAALAVAIYLAHFSKLRILHPALYEFIGFCLAGVSFIIAINRVCIGFFSGVGIVMMIVGGYIYLIVEGHIHDKDDDLSGWE